ncbi:OmpA family protein [Acinetobacter sp. MB5]|uniref:OmpA family protein n=1 Tax=Acinetobacter sp. MB5 TaxID=2069438 RepID=UPI000DD0D8A0|nr:OmpA family protein [Acinetobacter sp. MB5]
MPNNNKIALLRGLILIGALFSSCALWAQPVVVEGVVPDQTTKQSILNKMRSVYGQDQVVDKIQVRAVSAPSDWSNTVTQAISPDLKKVSQGKLTVQGTQVQLTGKVSNPNELQPLVQQYQSLIPSPYHFTQQLQANQAEQSIVDQALKNRIIEFESGSSVLTDSGKSILDEMATALHKVGNKKVKIIGHTDSSGDATKNLKLSQERAEAVKAYLIGKSIAATNLSSEGMGANKPVADNATPEGRRKNRRIEFEVL